MKEINHLLFWKHLVNFWSWLALLFFIAAFVKPDQFNNVLASIAVIYASILAIYVGSKEIARWQNKNFISKYYGEIFIIT